LCVPVEGGGSEELACVEVDRQQTVSVGWLTTHTHTHTLSLSLSLCLSLRAMDRHAGGLVDSAGDMQFLCATVTVYGGRGRTQSET